jgi:hypothetical protein
VVLRFGTLHQHQMQIVCIVQSLEARTQLAVRMRSRGGWVVLPVDTQDAATTSKHRGQLTSASNARCLHGARSGLWPYRYVMTSAIQLELPSYCCFPGQVEAHAGMIARAEQEAARLAEERQSVSLRAAQLAAQVLTHTHWLLPSV